MKALTVALALLLSMGAAQATPARVWRLTPAQYAATLEDLLGVKVTLPFGAPARQDAFLNNPRALEVNDVFFSDLEEGVRAVVTQHRARLEAQLPCRVGLLDVTCLRRFVRAFGARAFRSDPIDPAPYERLFRGLRRRLDRREAFKNVVVAILLSPKALFRSERGPAGGPETGAVALTAVELAESLAYTLWNAPPDEALRRRAADGSLARPEVLQAEVGRMLDAPAGRIGLREFVLQWAGLGGFAGIEKSPKVFPEWKALKGPMLEEATRFVDHVLSEREGRLSDLLALSRPPEDQRIGLFTQPAVLSAMSDASLTGLMYRGKFLLDRLLCVEVPPPDDVRNVRQFNQEVKEAHADRSSTIRDRLEELEFRRACKSCHSLLHPLAFPMENYDPIGRYRTQEHDLPIDASGTVTTPDGRELVYRNAVEMFKALAEDPAVGRCFARQVFRYVFGRLETDGDVELVEAAFRDGRREGQMTVRELFTVMLGSDAFRTRDRR